ncbi:MAG: acyltransferase [Kineosporiaceae bacterium]
MGETTVEAPVEAARRPDDGGGAGVSLVLASLGQDVVMSWRHFWRNTVGGSPFLPRVVRYPILRLAGVATRTPNLFPGSRFHGKVPVHIGEATFVNRECYFEGNAPIRIGRRCHVGMRVTFVTSAHPVGPRGFAVHARPEPISVGDDCWIGAGATLLPGVTLADGVVVAAGAVVTKDCPTPGVWGGVPARLLRGFETGVDHSGT